MDIYNFVSFSSMMAAFEHLFIFKFSHFVQNRLYAVSEMRAFWHSDYEGFMEEIIFITGY